MRACTQCGKCCIKYGDAGLGSASDEEIRMWRRYRPDVLRYTDALGDLWLSPTTGEEMPRCPWLRKLPRQEKYICRIHELRPDCCHGYPVNIDQMLRDGCEMLEPGDLDRSLEDLQRDLQALRGSSDPPSAQYGRRQIRGNGRR